MCRKSLISSSVILTAASIFLLGCADEAQIVAPLDERAKPDAHIPEAMLERSIARSAVLPSQDAHPTMTVSLRVDGNVLPGGAFTARATARANEDLTSATLSIWSPEIEFAARRGWGRSYRAESGWPIPAAARSDGAPRRNGTLNTTALLTVQVPGVYRIVAAAEGIPVETTRASVLKSHQVAWLVFDDDSAVVVATRDEVVYPDGVVPEPGPFRTLAPPPGDPMTMSFIQPGSWEVAVQYLDLNLNQILPVPNHKVTIVLTHQDPDYGTIEEEDSGYTDANGMMWWTCQYPEWQAIRVEVDLDTHGFDYPDSFRWSQQYGHCLTMPQGGPTVELDSEGAAALALLKQASAGGTAFFGVTRGRLKVQVQPTTPLGGSYYSPSEDRIYFKDSSIWSYRADNIVHHEFGHAIHATQAFGGLPSTSPNCSAHAPGVITSYQCAFAEGFADFYADVAGAPDPFIQFESHSYHADSPDGLASEGAWTAVLLDLTDSSSEPWDTTQYPGGWIASVFENCSVNVSGVWFKADRPHWMLTCMEESLLPYFEGWFPVSDAPNAFSTAPRPPGWSGAAIKANYTHNLFNNVSG